jgi:hypothetical protein
MRHGVTCVLATVLGWSIVGVARAAPDGAPAPEILPQWTHELATLEDYAVLQDARAGVGALVSADNRLIAFAPDGAIRWITYSCLVCEYSGWIWAKVTADGGALAIETGDSGTQEVVRLDAHGRRTLSVPIASPGRNRGVHADADQVIVVDLVESGVRRQRVDLVSGSLDTWSVDVDDDDPYDRLYALYPTADGGVTVMYGPDCGGIGVCPPLPPSFFITRIAADGMPLWGVAIYGSVHLEPDGGATVVTRDADYRYYLRRVTADGEVEPDILLDGIVGEDWVGLAGRYGDRLVLYRRTLADVTTFWVADESGNVLVRRAFDEDIRVAGISSLGIFMGRYDARDADLMLDPETLETLAIFRFSSADAGADEVYFNGGRILPDGSFYATRLERLGGTDFTQTLGRFILPGFTADDRRDRAQTGRAWLRHRTDPGTPRLHDRASPRNDRRR